MFAIVLGRFFLGRKNRSPKWVYILSAFVLGCRGIWESGKLWLETTGGRWNGEFFRTGLYFVLYDLLLLSLVIVFVFQARILSKKENVQSAVFRLWIPKYKYSGNTKRKQPKKNIR